MEFKLDFTEVDAPTAKQIDMVQNICIALRIAKPSEYTFHTYSEFIDEYMDEYRFVEYEEFGRNYDY